MLARQKQAVGAIFLPLGRKKLQMAKGPAQFLRRESQVGFRRGTATVLLKA
jgi:hypothetical protein